MKQIKRATSPFTLFLLTTAITLLTGCGKWVHNIENTHPQDQIIHQSEDLYEVSQEA